MICRIERSLAPMVRSTLSARLPVNCGGAGRSNAPAAEVTTSSGNLTVNERQARAIQYVRDHGRITNKDFQVLCPNVTPETLRMDLADLVDKNLLMRVGEKKGT